MILWHNKCRLRMLPLRNNNQLYHTDSVATNTNIIEYGSYPKIRGVPLTGPHNAL